MGSVVRRIHAMKPWLQLCRRGSSFCAHCLLSFCCWTIWLVLLLALVFQIYISFARELPVPQFLLRSLESRLATSGIKADFGRTTLDPTGRVLVENLRLSLNSLDEPAATAQQLYVQLDPWALLAGSFESRQIRAHGVNLRVPAMLSDTGRGEDLLHDMDLVVTLHEKSLELHYFTAKLAELSLSAKGVIDLSSLPRANAESMPVAEWLATHYPRICRNLTSASRHLAGVGHPRAELELLPAENLGAIVGISFRGSGFKDEAISKATVGAFQLSTRVPLWSPNPFFARIDASTASVDLPDEGVSAAHLRTTLRARLTHEKMDFSPLRAELEIGRITAHGVTLRDLSANLRLGGLPALEGDLVARLGRETVQLRGGGNIVERSASVHVQGGFDPDLLIPIGEKVGRDIRSFLDFGAPPSFDLDVEFAPGGKFAGLAGRVSATDVYARRVTLDRIDGHIAFDGDDFVATDAKAWIGSNFARGSYEHNIASREFRFLLTGQLRPPDISGWFREWWPNFWANFDFSQSAPRASVDVLGQWGRGPDTSVFVYVDSDQPVIKGVALDHATTLIYLRPHYYDAMDLRVRKGTGQATGNFVRRHSPVDRSLQRMDFDFSSSLDTATAAGLAGPAVQSVVKPFKLARDPQLKIRGYLAENGPGPLRHIEVEGQTTDGLTFHGFPLNDLDFRAVMIDDELQIEPLRAGFAGGVTTGRIEIRGASGQQRLGFDLSLKQGNLEKAAGVLAEYSAAKHGVEKAKPSNYIQQTANVTVDMDVSAEGDLDDPFSFEGSGNAELRGRGLGEIRLLGLLSELLNFTALRFNDLRANFTVERDHLEFSEVSITGSNAAINAHGDYALDTQTLDFNARIYPFQESKFILKNVMGMVLSPLSSVLEVKLTGALADPKWAFVIGPTNFLRQLTQPTYTKPAQEPKTDQEPSTEPDATAPDQSPDTNRP